MATFRPLAWAALAAAPIAPSQAAVVLAPDLATPTTACAGADPSAGGTLSWSSGLKITPSLSLYDGATLLQSGPLDCAGGTFAEPVARKSSPDNKDFLKIVLKEVIVAGLLADESPNFQFDFFETAVVGADGATRYDAYWNIVGAYTFTTLTTDTLAPQKITVPSRNFIGLKFSSTASLANKADVKYSYDERALSFSLPLQDVDGSIGMTTAPVSAVPAPATLGLLGLGLAGAAAARRRRRGW